MEKSDLTYEIIRSRRKTIALIVLPDSRLIVRCGLKTPLHQVESFIHLKQNWISQKRLFLKQLIPLSVPEGSESKILRAETKEKVMQVISKYPQFTPSEIVIRKQQKRWGSCSRRGRININTLAGQLPSELFEYLVVHELCHLKHFNHSPAFYQLLTDILPDARHRQNNLKNYSIS